MVLEYPQELHLQGGGQFSNFIQEEGPARGLLEQAAGGLVSPGVRPPDMAKQLVFQQALRDSPAVNGHKRALGSAAGRMDGLGNQLFTRTALAYRATVAAVAAIWVTCCSTCCILSLTATMLSKW